MAGVWLDRDIGFLYDDDEFDGQWFLDGERRLYIVPCPGWHGDIIGPDDTILEILNLIYRTYGDVPERMAVALGLESVPMVLRRWTPQDGYYTV